MKPFTSKDGSRFTNRSTMMQHEARQGAGKPAAEPDGQDADSEMDAQPQDGAAMADEHGAATEVQVHHDHEAGKHTVHASHPDGHEHDTEHASADDAHKFAAECAGCGGSGGGQMGGGGGMSGGMGGE